MTNTAYESEGVRPSNSEAYDKAISELTSKMLDLVWFGRKPNYRTATKADWKEWEQGQPVPERVFNRMIEGLKRVEKTYPDEVRNLRGNEADFYHGFNSGMLAALRFVGTASQDLYDEVEDEWIDGIQMAQDLYPDLDT